MPKLTKDVVLTQQHVRGFVTYGRPRPGNAARYYGVQGSPYFFVGGVSNPVQGDISPINVPAVRKRKAYEQVGRTVEPPALGEYELMVGHKHGTLPRVLGGGLAGCPITTTLTAGRCKDPSDLNRGYESYLYIMANGEATERDLGDMFPQDSDEIIQTTLTVVTDEQYGVAPLAFGAQADGEINAEVIDVTYGWPQDCDDCGDGTEWIYAITRPIGGSPTFQAEVVYSTDGGVTWANVTITGLSAAAVPTAIDVVGGYLVVLVNSAEAHYWAPIDPDTGAPGAWTAVTAGYVSSAGPRDLWVASPTEVWIVGDSGYIYRSRDITASVTPIVAGTLTAQSYRRVHGVESTIVAVGASGEIAITLNGGATWATPQTTFPINGTLTAVAVKDETHFWVAGGSGGAGSGRLFYTLNGGKAWLEDTEATASAALEIQDIVFPTDHVGYVAFTVTGPEARIACTVDGGDSWTTGAARMAATLPVCDRINRLAVPLSDPQTAANNVYAGGLAGDGVEGILLNGVANVV
jgi:hypothetical protein